MIVRKSVAQPPLWLAGLGSRSRRADVGSPPPFCRQGPHQIQLKSHRSFCGDAFAFGSHFSFAFGDDVNNFTLGVEFV